MPPVVQVVLSGTLTFGVPLLLALRELHALRRIGPGPDDRDRGPDPGPQLPPGDSPPARQLPSKPLPACLVPTPRPVRVAGRAKELESV